MTTHSTDNSDEKTGKTSYTTDTTWKLGQDEKKLHYSYESTEESKTETAVTDLITGTKQTIERNLENGNETVKIGDTISWNATQEEKQGKITYKNGSTLLYTYDDNGNITKISEKSDSDATETILATYSYDGMSQLLRENNRQANTTTVYSYDTNGNLTESKVYPYTEGNISGNPTTTHTWNYKNSDWRDLLTEYDGSTITYDAGGNPLTYRNGSNLTWQGGRQLKQYEDSKQTVRYTYNDEGIRTKKTVTNKQTGKTVTKNYYLNNSNILAEEVTGSDNDRTIWYAYNGEGKLTGFTYDGADYYYQRNLQDDIIGIYNASGDKVVSYNYDAWGKLTKLTDDSGKNLGEINPFRYRGYYYDEDTSWYYLQSRYYDVEVGRFLNADDVHYLGEEGISCNLFTYCVNNPVNNKDENGMFTLESIKKLLKKVSPWIAVASVIANFAAFIVSWLSLSGKIRNMIINGIAVASMFTATWQYVMDFKKYRNKDKNKFNNSTTAFIICMVSNVITILLTVYNLSKCRTYIKKFLWFLGTSFGLAIAASAWVYDLVLKPRVTYKWVKTKIR